MESLNKPHSYLKKISGKDSGKIYPLSALVSTIGRGNHNTICLQDCFLSRKHCCIKYENPDWIISDCGGINGTFVNGEKIDPNGIHVLRGRSIIFLGDPEESTCGFIFSPNISCPDNKSSKDLMSTFSSSSANPGPSSSNQEHHFSSHTIESSNRDEPVSEAVSCQPVWTVPKNTGLDCNELERCKESTKATRPNFSEKEQPAHMRTFPCVYESGALNPDVSGVRNRRYHPVDAPANPITSPVVETGENELYATSSSRASGEGCSRTDPPEFRVLDMLVDSVTSDLSDDSDCSISSTDSLRTRILKQKEKRSKAGKRLKHALKTTPFGVILSNPQKLNLPVELNLESEVSTKEQHDTSSSQDSESLIRDMEDEVRNSVSELENGDWMCESKPMDSDAVLYLKERVLKLQKTVMDASEELKKVLEKNKKQEAVIEELQGKQGISREELCEDLENELSCNICTEILIKPVILDCGHIFCEYCIAVWKKKKKQCPNCREPIKLEKEIKVLDAYLSKAVERLEPSYCNKRNELIETRSAEIGKLKKSGRKRSQPYRVPAAGNEPSPDVISELRVYRSFHNSRLQRNALALHLRQLRDVSGPRRSPLLRRLVDRIERNFSNEALP